MRLPGRSKIKAMLSFDTIGSPDFVRCVYDSHRIRSTAERLRLSLHVSAGSS